GFRSWLKSQGKKKMLGEIKKAAEEVAKNGTSSFQSNKKNKPQQKLWPHTTLENARLRFSKVFPVFSFDKV
ncbi:MAG: hypothetical protein PHE77_01640, partial [Candidatus Pacebacteria bacterium]|nr:hypothetical protein [Candidatus Paceibacterota bacterium]